MVYNLMRLCVLCLGNSELDLLFAGEENANDYDMRAIKKASGEGKKR